ncbi:hypothetical protein SISNIDRAFT_460478, partial [Sistotremastrum niveocremeum HHB9708]
TSASLRALILSDKRILAAAFNPNPFDLPAGTTLENPPPHFLVLCLNAFRIKERLWSADMTQALKPLRHKSVLLPDIAIDEVAGGLEELPIPHAPLIFGDIIVYLPQHGPSSLLIADLANPDRLLHIPTEQPISIHCRMLEDNATLRIAYVVWDSYHAPYVDDYDVTGEQFQHVRYFRAPAIQGRHVLEPLIEGDNVYVADGPDVYLFNVREKTGVQLKLEGIYRILRIRSHPDLKHLIVEHVDEEFYSQVHISVILIPHSTTKLPEWPDLENHELWPVQIVSPVRKLSYPNGWIIPDEPTADNRAFRRLPDAGPRPSSLSSILEVVQCSVDNRNHVSHVKQTLISSSSWEFTSNVYRAPNYEAWFGVLVTKMQGIQMRFSDFATLMIVGHTAAEEIHVLRTTKSGDVGWIHLDVSSEDEDKTKIIHGNIWGFDLASGRLFVHDRDSTLHVIYY